MASDFASSRNSSSTCVPIDGVEVGRRLVGQEHRAAIRPAPARWRRAASARRRGRGEEVQAVGEARPGRATRGGFVARRRARACPFTLSAYSTFSSAVRAGNRLYCWKTKPIDRRRTSRSCSRLRRVDALAGHRRPRPRVGVRMQPMIESSVVLPEPDGPSRATTSPGRHRQRHAAQDLDASVTLPRRPSHTRLSLPGRLIVPARSPWRLPRSCRGTPARDRCWPPAGTRTSPRPGT